MDRSGTAWAAARIRGFILLIFVAGSVGTGADLLLLGHFEDFWQWVPLVLLPLGLIVVAWQRADRGPRSTRILQGTSVLFLSSGVTGLWLHFTANAEFELEMYPSLGGWDLVREALTGATPTLAPAAMIQLGLLGLTYTYRHPYLEREPPATASGAAQEC